MKKVEQLPITYSLISGTFTADEAQDILVSMISSKIFFHGAKIMKSFEKNGSRNHTSRDRIKELKETRNQIIRLLQESGDKKFKVRITSDISIERIK